jgi:hypothetical protein
VLHAGASGADYCSLEWVQNKDRMLHSFASRSGYVPFLEELLSMGANAAFRVCERVEMRREAG